MKQTRQAAIDQARQDRNRARTTALDTYHTEIARIERLYNTTIADLNPKDPT